ncbi:hypothetical protein [Aquisalimonas sp.]|uniref:hypothetical protein n=1 Tax=Aquisalimonas sp. TaxID=1872621 RepID=UPI0025C45A01|nr:hypothetical protein [Aquisalimonas sp.]
MKHVYDVLQEAKRNYRRNLSILEFGTPSPTGAAPAALPTKIGIIGTHVATQGSCALALALCLGTGLSAPDHLQDVEVILNILIAAVVRKVREKLLDFLLGRLHGSHLGSPVLVQAARQRVAVRHRQILAQHIAHRTAPKPLPVQAPLTAGVDQPT